MQQSTVRHPTTLLEIKPIENNRNRKTSPRCRTSYVSKAEMLDTLKHYLNVQDYKPQTIEIVLQNASWLIANYRIVPDLLTVEMGEKIKTDMKARSLKATTIKQRLYAYDYLCAAYGKTAPDGSEIRIKKPPRNKPTISYLTIPEARALLDCAGNYRDKCVLAILLYLGCRVGELSKIELTHIDLENKVIHLYDTKNGSNRDLPLANDEVLTALREWLRYRPASSKQPYLFMTAWDTQLDKDSVDRIVKKAAARAGITKPISPHKLRHTAASSLLKQGTPITEISLLLGHATLSTTVEYYLHASMDDLKGSLKKFSY